MSQQPAPAGRGRSAFHLTCCARGSPAQGLTLQCWVALGTRRREAPAHTGPRVPHLSSALTTVSLLCMVVKDPPGCHGKRDAPVVASASSTEKWVRPRRPWSRVATSGTGKEPVLEIPGALVWEGGSGWGQVVGLAESTPGEGTLSSIRVTPGKTWGGHCHS